jgi:hypothetical protein
MYEIPHWMEDKNRREAIEMLASWPLMSLAIRPFLELASFFPIKFQQLFCVDPDAFPLLPIHAQQLRNIYASQERSEKSFSIDGVMRCWFKSILQFQSIGHWHY